MCLLYVFSYSVKILSHKTPFILNMVHCPFFKPHQKGASNEIRVVLRSNPQWIGLQPLSKD